MNIKNLFAKLFLVFSGICAISSTQATNYTWSTASGNWNSSSWLGTPAVNASTGPVVGDNIFGSGGNVILTLVTDRQVDNLTNLVTVGTWTLQVTTGQSAVFTVGDITNASTGNLNFRAAIAGALMSVNANNITQGAGSGITNLGTIGVANALESLNVSGTTTVSSGNMNINLDNDLLVDPDTYSLGIVDVSGVGILNLNQANYTKSGTMTANSAGLIGSGGSIVNGSNVGGAANTTSLVLTTTGSYSSGSNLGNGSAGTLSLTKSGAGAQTLSGSNSYSGGTTITAGTLIITSTNGAGTGAVSVAAGTLHVNALSGSAAISNAVTITNNNGEYILERANGTSLSAFAASSDIAGGQDTAASILSGTASTARTLTSGFDTDPTVSATNDELRASDVFSLEGTGTDIFVLQLQIADVVAGQYLGWLNGSDTWVNAVTGNSGTGGSAVTNWAGSFASSGASATSDYLGSWGYDTSANTVWAVLDHNSEFSVVPEPSSVVLVFAGLGVLAFWGAKRRKLAGMR